MLSEFEKIIIGDIVWMKKDYCFIEGMLKRRNYLFTNFYSRLDFFYI